MVIMPFDERIYYAHDLRSLILSITSQPAMYSHMCYIDVLVHLQSLVCNFKGGLSTSTVLAVMADVGVGMRSNNDIDRAVHSSVLSFHDLGGLPL